MGVELDRPGAERVPPFTLGVSDVNPLEMAERLRDVRRPRPALRRPAGHRDPERDGKTHRGYPEAVPAGAAQPDVADAVNDILEGVQDRRRVRRDAGMALNQPSAGKTGTTDERLRRLVRRLHPEPGGGRR